MVYYVVYLRHNFGLCIHELLMNCLLPVKFFMDVYVTQGIYQSNMHLVPVTIICLD